MRRLDSYGSRSSGCQSGTARTGRPPILLRKRCRSKVSGAFASSTRPSIHCTYHQISSQGCVYVGLQARSIYAYNRGHYAHLVLIILIRVKMVDFCESLGELWLGHMQSLHLAAVFHTSRPGVEYSSQVLNSLASMCACARVDCQVLNSTRSLRSCRWHLAPRVRARASGPTQVTILPGKESLGGSLIRPAFELQRTCCKLQHAMSLWSSQHERHVHPADYQRQHRS